MQFIYKILENGVCILNSGHRRVDKMHKSRVSFNCLTLFCGVFFVTCFGYVDKVTSTC
jgi:hypothetical protein